MKQFLKKTMKLQNRHFHTALSLAVCQLLVACAQPQQNNYVSHFGAGQQSEGYVFNDEDQSVGKKASEKSSTPEPRLLEGTGKLLADAKPSKALKDAQVKLSFEDAPLAQVVRTVLGDILALDYVLHPPITGTVTLSTQQNVSGDNALYLLEAALQANGMGIARDARGTYHVGRLDALKGLGAAVRQASPTQPLAPGYGAIVVPLNYIGANEMAAILRPMVPGDAILRVDNVRNMLVMAGSRAQAEGWLEMVRTFDVNVLEGMSVGVFPLKYVSIQEVSAALQLMSGGGAPGAGAPGAGVAPAATTARPGGRRLQHLALPWRLWAKAIRYLVPCASFPLSGSTVSWSSRLAPPIWMRRAAGLPSSTRLARVGRSRNSISTKCKTAMLGTWQVFCRVFLEGLPEVCLPTAAWRQDWVHPRRAWGEQLRKRRLG